MNQGFRFFLFLTIVVSVYFGMHFYVYRRMVSGLSLSSSSSRWVLWIFIIGGCSFILGEVLDRTMGLVVPFRLTAIWMGLITVSVFLVLLRDIFHIFFYAVHPSPTITAYGVLVSLVVIGGYSLLNGYRFPVLREFDIPIANLPEEIHGMTLVQLSDLHLDRQTSIKRLSSIVARVNECQPDFVVITGDLVDRHFDVVSRFVPVLMKIKARYGVFTVMGNHDVYSGVENYLTFVDACGFTDLSNKVVEIGDTKLQLAGISDYEGTAFGYSPDVEGTLARCNTKGPIIFLSHQPLSTKKAFSLGVDFMLAGHTHAGQIPPMDIIVHLIYRFPWGLYSVGDARIYTSCGTGTWGPPMRFFSRSEIVKFTLTIPRR